jgi:hypothetical protein
MQHSLAAKLAPWSAARFVRPAGREWERRLGLHSSLSFQPAATRLTILRPSHGGLQVTGWRPVTTRPSSPRNGRPRAAVTIRWTGGRPQADRRSSLAAAPWRA